MTTLLVTCGALAREVIAIRDRHGWDAKVLALPALYHNTPERIPGAVAARIERSGHEFERVIVVYGDCGTGGMLDRTLEASGIERVSGPHCYEMYAGAAGFAALAGEEPGTFYLTDYLARSFDHLVIEGLGLDRAPELRDSYFKNYRRMVYLQQRDDPALLEKARAAAEALSLPLEVRPTGYGALESRLIDLMQRNGSANGKPHDREE
jgi:hypothetical protein